MELFTHRYRNLSILLLAVVAQLLLLGYQIRSRQDVRLLRVWSVTAVTELSGLVETFTSGLSNAARRYVLLVNVKQDNERLRREVERLKLETQHLRAELSTAERAEALRLFQARTPSKTLAARIIGAGTVLNSKVVFVNAGAGSGVQNGMAVVTPDGVVGRVRAAYPSSSQVVLITDPSFAAGVISQKHHVQGTLKGKGLSVCPVEYIQNEDKVEAGEWFFTSGDDRVFPRGLPVGQAVVVRRGRLMKEVLVAPSGLQNGIEEVLIVLEGVHQSVPEVPLSAQDLHLLPPPPTDSASGGGEDPGAAGRSFDTDADRLRERYRRVGEAQGHVFGHGLPGSAPPNFNLEPPAAKPSAPAGPVEPPSTP
jgi:rod shape-determining protein MreC